VLAGVLFGVLASVAVLMFVPARFTASSSMVVKAQDAQSSLLSRLGVPAGGAAGGLLPGGGQTPIETEIQILSSRAVAEVVVDSLLLQIRVRGEPRVPARSLFEAASLPGSFKRRKYHFQRAGTAGQYQVTGDTALTATAGSPVPLATGRVTLAKTGLPPSFDIRVYDREEAITRFGNRLRVGKAGGEVVRVAYEADDSLTAARVPNFVIQNYLSRRKTTDRGVNQRKVEMLAREVDSMDNELRVAAQALRRHQERSGVIDPEVVGKVELERASELRKELGTLDVERGAIDRLLAQLSAGQLAGRDLAAYPTFLRSSAINDLLGQLSQLETKRYQLLAKLTPEDPEVIAVTEGIKNIEGQLPPLARTYAGSLAQQRGDVSRQLDTVRAQIEALPAATESSALLQREVLRLGQVGLLLQTQLVEQKLAAIGEGGDVRLLDVAQAPRKVSFPQRSYTLAAGVAGGLMLGLLLSVLTGTFGRYVVDMRAIEREAGVPAIALEPGTPLLLAGNVARTVLLLPLDARADTAGVAERLLRTAMSRSLTGTVLDLSGHALPSGDAGTVNAQIDRLSREFDFVAVRLPELGSDGALGALNETRPVLLVASAGRVNRHRLSSAVDTLQRLSIPCAGVVLSCATENRGTKALVRA
jgi:uncharacterized protein involved in exopolysaccharide biosynthesis